MTLLLNGTNGVSDVDGTAATPAIRGTDTNTGIFFPAADTIAFAEGGAEVARFDSSGNLGIGTTSTSGARLTVRGAGTTSATASFEAATSGGATRLYVQDDGTTRFFGSSNSETMRIDSSGNLLVGMTNTGGAGVAVFPDLDTGGSINVRKGAAGSGSRFIIFDRSGVQIGAISQNGTTGVTYATSSDYRLKENIAPMTGALDTVAQLKPVTYNWKVDGSSGQGFIAHELQAVVPDCVTGEKDAVETYTDEDGVEQTRPKYQGIDTSFLVATLTKAIQEQQAIITDLKARIETLEAK